MRIACVGYRDWALSIYDEIASKTDHKCLIFRSKANFDELALRDFKPDIVLFYGWSWMIDSALIKDYHCIMLHPSPLPRYRGGSPIQNQIIAGENESAVCLFIIDEGVDTGPIVAKKMFSLSGNLNQIFQRITNLGVELTLEIISNGLNPVSQNNAEATTFKRRKPEESEITLEEISEKSSEYLYNKIRMLQSPYPNAFISTSDGKRLLILDAKVDENLVQDDPSA